MTGTMRVVGRDSAILIQSAFFAFQRLPSQQIGNQTVSERTCERVHLVRMACQRNEPNCHDRLLTGAAVLIFGNQQQLLGAPDFADRQHHAARPV